MTDEENGYKFVRGANWTPENVRTILQWIHICSINLDVMCESAKHYKVFIRRNTILGLVLSTLASTASLSQFNITDENYPGISTALKVMFTVFATIVALSTGFIKVYQVQEKLEKAIKLQQEWTAFGSMLSSELQLPVNLRKDALSLIVKYKDTYTELFKQQVDVSKKILARVAKRNGLEPHALSLSELFERVLDTEAKRVQWIIDSKQQTQLSTYIYAEPTTIPMSITPPRRPSPPMTRTLTPPRRASPPLTRTLTPPRSLTPPSATIQRLNTPPKSAESIESKPTSQPKESATKSTPIQKVVARLGSPFKQEPSASIIQLQRENMSRLVIQPRNRK